jgi:hypothetical protein
MHGSVETAVDKLQTLIVVHHGNGYQRAGRENVL